MSSEKKIEKLNPMTITDAENGKEYTLEFSRKSVVKTEQAGFDVNRIESSTMTMIPILFWGAFQMHHPYMTREKTDKILFEDLGGLSEEEMEHLAKLYAEPFQTLITSKEGSEGNPRKMAVKF